MLLPLKEPQLKRRESQMNVIGSLWIRNIQFSIDSTGKVIVFLLYTIKKILICIYLLGERINKLSFRNEVLFSLDSQ